MIDYSYTYSLAGLVSARNTEHGNYAYSYDQVNRLSAVDSPADDEAYTYDPLGNRLSSAEHNNWVYDDNNRLQFYGSTSFIYNNHGSMTRKTVAGVVSNFVYTVDNRLQRVEDGGNTTVAFYYYDPFGRRLWKEVGGTRTYFHYNDEGLAGEYNASGAELRTYGYHTGTAWSSNPLFVQQNGEYYWYQNDHLGTPQKIIAENGEVVWSARYDGFGRATVDVETVVNNLRFPGQYFDGETSLHYNFHRYYNPETGRYLTADPIGLQGGINLYAYVQNDPVNWIDPWGLAKYYINYTIKSYSPVIAPVGMAKISGLIVSTRKNSDGTYNAIKFKGLFYGAALGPLPWATTINNEEYFKDDCEKPNLYNIEGRAWYLSGSMALYRTGISGGAYQFGELIGTKETPSGAQGFDLGVDFMMGKTWTDGTMFKVSPNIFPRNMY